MILDIFLIVIIIVGMFLSWEALVHYFPEAFMSNYDNGNNDASGEEE
jgi:hypothetical protein